MIDNVRGTLIGMAATKVKDLLGELVPGFHEEFDRRQRLGAPGAPSTVAAPTCGAAVKASRFSTCTARAARR